VWPLREVTSTLSRIEVSRIENALKHAFRNGHNQVVQVAEFIEGSRERVSDLSDLYQTMVSEKTN
jgi:Mg2+ and Co2+ transporter CorA